jgi:hypothetical protein
MAYSMVPMKPEDLFRAEKERAVTARNSQHARLLAEAKAAFDKLMAEGQAARKSGRPRKHPLPPLKTSSSRPMVKPAAPMEQKPPAAAIVQSNPAPPPKAAKSQPHAVTKQTTRARKVAKAKDPPGSRRAATKSKPKAKRSKRR